MRYKRDVAGCQGRSNVVAVIGTSEICYADAKHMMLSYCDYCSIVAVSPHNLRVLTEHALLLVAAFTASTNEATAAVTTSIMGCYFLMMMTSMAVLLHEQVWQVH